MVGYLSEGTFTLENNGAFTDHAAGGSVIVGPGVPHEGINRGSTQIKALVACIVEKGKPLAWRVLTLQLDQRQQPAHLIHGPRRPVRWEWIARQGEFVENRRTPAVNASWSSYAGRACNGRAADSERGEVAKASWVGEGAAQAPVGGGAGAGSRRLP
jgi:hypothetical protein